MYPNSTHIFRCIILGFGILAATAAVADYAFVQVSSSDKPSYEGEIVTYTISVGPSSGSGPTPTGTVSLLHPVAPVAGCENLPLVAGIASCSTASLPVGDHLLYGSYSGDAVYNAAQSESYFQRVNASANPATVNLSASVNPSTFGQAVTFTASLSGGSGTPTGTIEFKDGSAAIFGCSAVPLSSGSASCTTTGLAPGTHSIKARYAGNSTYTGSASALHNQTVTSAPGATTRAWASIDTSSPVKELAASTAATPSAMDAAGNLYAIVTTTGSEPCAMTIKYASATGAVVWHRDICGPSAAAGSVALDAAGDVLLTGSIEGDLYVAKYEAATGAPTWERRISTPPGGSGNNVGIAIGVDAAGNPRVAARAGTAITVYAFNGGNGASQWQRAIAPGLSAQLNAFAVDAAGGSAVGDRRILDASSNVADVVTRLDASGAIVWEQATGGIIDAVAIDGDGNVINSGVPGTDKRSGTTGAVLWHDPFRGYIATDASRNVYLAGSTGDIALMKLSPAGTVLWRSAFIDPATFGFANAVSIDGAGNLAVAGEANNAQGTTLVTIKFAPDDGHIIWMATEKDPTLRQRPVQVHAGANGVIAFGRAFPQSGGENQGIFLVKYAGTGTPPAPVDNDFNGDGHPDIVWSNTANGATYVWHMTGPPPALANDAFIALIDPAWKVQGIADFNGDGHPDLVWRNTTNGSTYVWYMNDAAFLGDAFLFALPAEWVIQGVADFNADDSPDFLLRNTVSGNAFAWFFDNATPIGDQFLFSIDPSWKVEAVADLTNDGQPDLVFRNMSSGLAFPWSTAWNGTTLSLGSAGTAMFSIDPAWEIVQLADWNGDANPDLLFRNRDSGVVFVWYLNGTTLAGSDFVNQIDPSWEIVPRR